MRDSKLGDEMPHTRNPKWGSMETGKSTLSNEWHGMEPSAPRMSEKWVEQCPSPARMSEKWVDMRADESPFSNEWHEMKQERRDDPYQMAPSGSDRTVGMKDQQKATPKPRHGQYDVNTSEGVKGKEL